MKCYLLIGIFLLGSLPALATGHQTQNQLEETVVTAALRPADVNTLAASISVLSADVVESRNATHIEDLLNLAPNVNFATGASRGRFFQIRGIGERSQFVEPINPSVGLLIDDIDFTGIGGAASTLDIKQVEILRGPQGTLMGTNALAGLINIRSNSPTSTNEAKFGVDLGN